MSIGRAIHFVGSIPARDAEEAMRDTLRWAGPGVRTLSDGETGERSGRRRCAVPDRDADRPAPLDPHFYDALADLALPAKTRLVAGFVHERRTLDQLRSTLALIEQRFGRPVDVAAACGLGRRTPEQATQNIDLTRQLRAA